ncbi:unnamed protein product [Rhodiola kirilowii]
MSTTSSKMLPLLLCFMLCFGANLATEVNVPLSVRAAYWPSFDAFPASSIDVSYFTHIYYAFLHPDPNTFQLVVTPLDHKKLPELIHGLKIKNFNGAKSVKTVISIVGGDNSDPSVFSNLSRTKAGRAAFIESTIEVARKYGFDGLDLDWEFPANSDEMTSLGFLFRDWKKALEKEARITRKPRLTLSAAVYYSSSFKIYGLSRSYPAKILNKYLDWVSPMCYDYHGSWDNFTGANAALYDPTSEISTVSGIGSWIKAGVAAGKIVMGLPMYGHTWKLQNPNVNGMGAPATGSGPGDGSMNYDQVIEFNERNRATVKYDKTSVSYYSYVGDVWIGYDDVHSIVSKVKFAKGSGLGGYFFWALGRDLNWVISKAAAKQWEK